MLRYSLNNNTTKVCLKKKNLPKEFKLIKLDSYLQKYVKADPTIDLPNWGNLFRGKETMQNSM